MILVIRHIRAWTIAMLLNLENEIEKTKLKGKNVDELLAKRFRQANTPFNELSKDIMIIYLTSIIKVTQENSDDILGTTLIDLLKN